MVQITINEINNHQSASESKNLILFKFESEDCNIHEFKVKVYSKISYNIYIFNWVSKNLYFPTTIL